MDLYTFLLSYAFAAAWFLFGVLCCLVCIHLYTVIMKRILKASD